MKICGCGCALCPCDKSADRSAGLYVCMSYCLQACFARFFPILEREQKRHAVLLDHQLVLFNKKRGQT